MLRPSQIPMSLPLLSRLLRGIFSMPLSPHHICPTPHSSGVPRLFCPTLSHRIYICPTPFSSRSVSCSTRHRVPRCPVPLVPDAPSLEPLVEVSPSLALSLSGAHDTLVLWHSLAIAELYGLRGWTVWPQGPECPLQELSPMTLPVLPRTVSQPDYLRPAVCSLWMYSLFNLYMRFS
jgi:hypothetical protein